MGVWLKTFKGSERDSGRVEESRAGSAPLALADNVRYDSNLTNFGKSGVICLYYKLLV